jgi:uncharacterized membrane protein
MSPFFLMLALYGLFHAPGLRRWPGGPQPWQKAAGAMGIALTLAGVAHFIRPDLFLPMVPAFLPAPEVIVLVSGIVELGIGIVLLVPRTRRFGGWASAAFFLAIWPGSIYMAITGVYPPEFPQTPIYHWARLPFQVLYIGWGVWVGMARLPVGSRPAVKVAPDG